MRLTITLILLALAAPCNASPLLLLMQGGPEYETLTFDTDAEGFTLAGGATYNGPFCPAGQIQFNGTSSSMTKSLATSAGTFSFSFYAAAFSFPTVEFSVDGGSTWIPIDPTVDFPSIRTISASIGAGTRNVTIRAVSDSFTGCFDNVRYPLP